jgi:hypothetical protein
LSAYLSAFDLADCDGQAHLPIPFPAEAYLNSPVGGREIVDALTGLPVPWFDERDAMRIPPLKEWTGSGSVGDIATFAADFGGAHAATFAMTYRGTGEDATPSPHDRLWIINSKGGAWTPPASTAVTPVTVRGRPGRAAAGIVVWEEGGLTLAVRWDTENRPRPTTEQLVAIAATLMPGEGR